MQRSGVTPLVPGILLLVVLAGAAALLATYWDDAWHTDLGRDDATIPPHLLLYGSVAVISIPVAWATSFLKPPVTADATEPAVAADVTPEPV